MRFSRTETSLKALFGRKQLTLNDVLDLFYDLGADIRDDQKMTVDRLPAEQEEAAVTRLSWLGRTLLRIFGRLPVEAMDQEQLLRFKKLENNLEEAQRQLESVSGRLTGLRQQAALLEQKKEQLEQSLEEEEKLLETCRQLTAFVQEYQEKKIPDIRIQKERLEEQYQQCKDACEGLQAQYRQKKEELEQLGEQARRTEARLQEAIRSHRENLLQNEKLEEEYQKRKQQFQNSDTQRRSLMEQIQNLEQSLSRTDIEDLRGLLRQREEEAAEREVQRQSLQEQIEKKEEALLQMEAEISGKQKRAQELVWQTEEERKKAEENLEQMERRKKTSEARKQELLTQTLQEEKETARLEDWFRSLEAAAYRQRLEQCKKRMQVLKRAREQLDGELRLLNGLLPAGKQAGLFQYQKYFRDTMEQLETVLNQYQNAYCIVTHLFENGGNSL